MQPNDADILKPIQIVNEANRKARHAIRKAIEATRDYAPGLIESNSRDLQGFTVNLQERAEKGVERL